MSAAVYIQRTWCGKRAGDIHLLDIYLCGYNCSRKTKTTKDIRIHSLTIVLNLRVSKYLHGTRIYVGVQRYFYFDITIGSLEM